MSDLASATAWFQALDHGECPLCVDLRGHLDRRLLTAAGEIALDLLSSGQAALQIDRLVSRLGLAARTGRVSVLVPEPGGRWRLFASSDRRETHDLMVDVERYPELLEVRRTGVPFLAADVRLAPELEEVRPLLAAAGVRGLAAFPVFTLTHSAEPVVLKVALPAPARPATLDFMTLAAHLLYHRLRRLPQLEVVRQLGLTMPPSGTYDPGTMLRLAPLAAVVIDGRGRVLHANARALWLLRGRERSDLTQPLTLGLRPQAPWEAFGSRWEAQLATYQGNIAVMGWSNQVGSDRILVLLEPHPQPRQRSHERRMRDTLAEKLRELEQANVQLEEHSRLRARFVSDAAHELKTPLSILRSYLETLSGDLSEGLSDEQREFLEAASHGAERLQRLVEELLDLAALDSGHLPLALGQVSSRTVVETMVRQLQALATHAEVRLVKGVVEDLAVRADRARLEQVLRNLVENGIKYTSAGGEVAIAVERRGDRAVLSVSDTGVGIVPEALPTIFDEFVRGPGNQRADGAGLGLAIVRRLVVAMGGLVWAESTPGSGSRFFVELPLWTGEG